MEKTTSRRELEFYLEVAQRVPVRTPAVLDGRREGDGAVLLLTDHPGSGVRAQWEAVVGDLAALHSADLPCPAVAGRWFDLRAPDRAPLEEFWSAPAERELLARVLGSADVLLGLVAALPAVPSHGDAHLGNVLVDDAGLVWVDWQEFGRASPAFDLGFCSARAVPADSGPVPAPALEEYAQRRGLDPVLLVLAVRAVELGVLVVNWPAFARFNPPEAVHRVRRRALELGRAGCAAGLW